MIFDVHAMVKERVKIHIFFIDCVKQNHVSCTWMTFNLHFTRLAIIDIRYNV